MIALRWGSTTDVGMVRDANQDAFLVDEPLFAVADGMGGHQGGEVASATALEVLARTFGAGSKDELLEAVRRANAKVWDKAQLDRSLHGMGTTLAALAVVIDDEGTDETFALVNVGDSRGYLFRDGELAQITEDHSLVEEMVRAGELTAEEAESHPRRNIVTRALGVEPTVVADLYLLPPQIGDRVLLCSDGLTRELSDSQIAGILRRLRNPDEAAKELVSQAKAHGGHDNITVVIVDVEDDRPPVEPEVAPVDEPAPVAAEKKAKEPKKKKKKEKAPKAPKPKSDFKTVGRIALFIAAVMGLLALGFGTVVWYTRASYFVGVEGENLVVYQGRPEKVLWFEKTLQFRSDATLEDVLPSAVPRLQEGVPQSSRNEALDYIDNLVNEASRARSVAGLPPASGGEPITP